MAFNGWTNKETWLVNLWLGDTLQEMQDNGETITSQYIEELVYEIADQSLGEKSNLFIHDLLNCAIYGVNYMEIASHYGESV